MLKKRVAPRARAGKYADQLKYAIGYIEKKVDISRESVAFLKPKGTAWFRTLKEKLDEQSFGYVELTRASDRPQGHESIVRCTMSSARELEFDHVFILGLNQEVTPHDADPDDQEHQKIRRLLVMALTRARLSVHVVTKPGEASGLLDYLQEGTYEDIKL